MAHEKNICLLVEYSPSGNGNFFEKKKRKIKLRKLVKGRSFEILPDLLNSQQLPSSVRLHSSRDNGEAMPSAFP